jgi:predicted  nucleic acid-binding Zn-ribbon protein
MRDFHHAAGVLLTALLGACLGCDSGERKQLQGEQRRLEERRQQLDADLQRVIGGKAALTEAEKAQAGPLRIQLREVEGDLARVRGELSKLD